MKFERKRHLQVPVLFATKKLKCKVQEKEHELLLIHIISWKSHSKNIQVHAGI